MFASCNGSSVSVYRFETEIENENAKTAANLKPLTMELTDLEKQVLYFSVCSVINMRHLSA